MDSRSVQIVAAVVEQSYKDLTPPAEDKNPLTDMSSHLCTCVLNTSYSWSGPRTTRRIHIRKGGSEGESTWDRRQPISIPILAWVSRSAVTQSFGRSPQSGRN